jgi:FAD/FMN-containing dehydrogenase
MNFIENKISGWGKYPFVNAKVFRPERYKDFNPFPNRLPALARGCGRSYGDASLLEAGAIFNMLHFNKMLGFDQQTGMLHVQAGATLDEILKVFVPRGWFLAVTPGTKFVTIGGAIASNVHGKNHHIDGAFGKFVKEMRILLADNTSIICSAESNRDIFMATLGGGGLTGIILDAKIQLKPIQNAYINQYNVKTKNFWEAFEIFDGYDQQYTYSVAWIDCLASGKNLGKSVVMFGNHAEKSFSNEPLKCHNDPKLAIPFHFPSFSLNKLSVKAFNALYYAKQLHKEKKFTEHYDSFFYPLDALHHWNRIYGKKGFLQWQCVIPAQHSKSGMEEILKKISKSGYASFLAVLKKMAAEEGILHFPVDGYTLALDFTYKKGVFQFMDALDEIVLKYKGRIYLTKDARLSAASFQKMYPEAEKWKRIKKEIDPKNKFQSNQAKRIGLIES